MGSHFIFNVYSDSDNLQILNSQEYSTLRKKLSLILKTNTIEIEFICASVASVRRSISLI